MIDSRYSTSRSGVSAPKVFVLGFFPHGSAGSENRKEKI